MQRLTLAPDPSTASELSPDGPGSSYRIHQRFSLSIDYDVVFTEDVLHPSNAALVDALTAREPDRRHRVLPVVDAGFAAAWPEAAGWLRGYAAAHDRRLELAGNPVVVVGGEAAKNDPAIVADLHARFQHLGLDRHSYVLILGGGAVQDAAGYAAATAHRGIRTVRLPTTVLAQCDSGVGVKNGVNAFGTKNFLGTFAPPFAVICDDRFLLRLPERDQRAGLAEAVKVALIRDARLFAAIEAQAEALGAGEAGVRAQVIRRCAALHLAHIAGGGDPFEQGSARPLDFGHWSAHKLEILSGHELRHGEAVAIGMLIDCRYAVEVGRLPERDFRRVFEVLRRLRLPGWHAALDDRRADGAPRVLDGLDEFREHLGGALTVTLLEGIGAAVNVHVIERDPLERALGWLRDAATGSP